MNAPAHGFTVADIDTIDANGHVIRYFGQGAGWRFATLLEKEPETIEWIDSFAPDDLFWDIGANVGIYSIYAGVRGIRTLAFEPHFANYGQLCATVALNQVQDVVTPLCLAFAARKSVSEMNLASLDVGTSMSNFGAALDFRGNPFDPAFRQGMVGYDIDSFVADFGVEIPNHIKIDVDGIELSIVEGARRTLADERVRSVSIELIDSDLQQVAAVTEILEGAGLRFVHKKQNAAFATPETRDVLNFLFHRDPEAYRTRAKPVGEAVADELVTTDQIVDAIVARIAAARLDESPCGNIYMQDMLPASVYHELVARLPADDMLDPIEHPDAVDESGRVTRLLLDLTHETLWRLPAEDQPFWEAMIEVFTSPRIAAAVTDKFGATLAARFDGRIPELVAVPIFYRDKPGYRIGIHPDAATKVATLQFYLPEDDAQAHVGTVFHRRSGEGFERLKQNRFLPNSAYAFVRTEESWHSVDQLGPQERDRNTIALTFYIKGQEYRSQDRSAGPIRWSAHYTPQLSRAIRQLTASFERRDDVATLFSEGGVGVELGVAAGDFSDRLLRFPHIAHLYSIDMWAGDRGHGIDQYREAVMRLDQHRARNSVLKMRFDEALPLFPDDSLDFVYVDGYAHDGQLNGKTFRDWFPKLKSGGIFSGDDYSPEWPLVVEAVNAFCAEQKLELHVIDCQEDSWNSRYPTWFAIKP
ncbi:class I SAM-dependent methyltransferase [Rhizorhabdus phycosphaerae]|uniref:class I SAM-dependent methyltransferase n=1 Tax=Rhizorhabdus phycosphaerae TaxID=2711156 RepID=UPI0013EB3649|nr:FkbM family methyltransferase [Rhizorhabdus phycosphaerae]